MELHVPGRLFLYFILIVLAASGFFFAVFMPSPEGFYAFIAVAALAGFGVSANICDTKHNKRSLVCPTGSDCDAVIRSRYAKFLGIPLEFWGMAYFFAIVLVYLLLIFAPQLFTPNMLLLVMFFSLAAGLFSLYLLFVQAFLLRQWCIWCILTAMCSLTIAVVSLVSVEVATAFLVRAENILDLLQFLGFILGLGSVTSAAFLFFHFLKGDASIDETELEAIKSVSELAWIGFGLVLISNFARFVAYPDVLLASGTFVAQVIALFVFALFGAILMIIYEPFLTYIPFHAPPEGHSSSTFVTLRRPTLTIGAITLTSWYFAFVIHFVPGTSTLSLLSVYALVVAAAVMLAVLWDWRLSKQTVQQVTSEHE